MTKTLLFLATILLCGTSCSDCIVPSQVPYADNYTQKAGLQHYREWGTYNTHDPSCIKVGDYYYVFSTDAYLGNPYREARQLGIRVGNIPYRRSKDLVNWEFMGWALPEIPQVAVQHVKQHNRGRGGDNIWAPYVVKYKDVFRLYFCVSAFATKVSYLGMAEASSIEGPWELKGCVVSTTHEDKMNAIDPSVVTDVNTGEQWLHYGSYFDGLYCVQLNPETGFPLVPGDKGHCTTRRYNLAKDNVEAPEIIYHPGTGYYYLFVSYDPLMTTYNIRVARSRHPQGPFYDYFGSEFSERVNAYPILTYSYRFENHPGWAGMGHCGVVNDGQDNFYLMNQGRLSPDNHQMVMHVRRILWTSDGWPVLSPERYAGIEQPASTPKRHVVGDWEIIRIKESDYKRGTEAGQVLWGENQLTNEEICVSNRFTFQRDGSIQGMASCFWSIKDNVLTLQQQDKPAVELILHTGLDWENACQTLLFSGIDSEGCSWWGKRVARQ